MIDVVSDHDGLFCLWARLDECDGCRDEAYALPNAPAPGRPFLAPRDSCVLFIGEAPPEDGGFWRPRNRDGLRERLLPSLPAWPRDLDCESIEALTWFVDAGYFFVQAMKWPLSASYNVQRVASRRALQHALQMHLEGEIEAINPRHVIALGGAARDACGALSEKHRLRLSKRAGVDSDRQRHHVFRTATGRDVPLHVTRLPGKRNESLGWTPVIQHDVTVFLHCDPQQKDCERIERPPNPPTSRRGRSKADREREAKRDREMLRRLKAVNLWPPPDGSSFDEVMAELHRRAGRQRRPSGIGVR